MVAQLHRPTRGAALSCRCGEPIAGTRLSLRARVCVYACVAHLQSAKQQDVAEAVQMCDFVSQLLLYHYRRSPHIARELVAIFPEVTAHLLSGAHEVYAEDFLDIFFNFIPPRVPATVDPASPVVAPAVDAEDAKNAPEPPPLRYHESVEIFVTSRLFQRALRQALGGGINASTANLTAVLAASSRLGVERWRALQIVQRLIEMCVPEVDEALIISGALQRALELFFEFPHHSMVHCLVLDMLKVRRCYRWFVVAAVDDCCGCVAAHATPQQRVHGLLDVLGVRADQPRTDASDCACCANARPSAK